MQKATSKLNVNVSVAIMQKYATDISIIAWFKSSSIKKRNRVMAGQMADIITASIAVETQRFENLIPEVMPVGYVCLTSFYLRVSAKP